MTRKIFMTLLVILDAAYSAQRRVRPSGEEVHGASPESDSLAHQERVIMAADREIAGRRD